MPVSIYVSLKTTEIIYLDKKKIERIKEKKKLNYKFQSTFITASCNKW